MSEYLTHMTRDGERWDQIAHRYYGDAFGYARIIQANPAVPIRDHLPGGLVLLIPVIEAQPTVTELPPWKRPA